MDEQRNNQEWDRIVEDFFDMEVMKLLETIHRLPKCDRILRDAEQTQAYNAFRSRMDQYAEEYIAIHTTAFTHGEITFVLVQERLRRGRLISRIQIHGGQITSSNLEGILRDMGVEVPPEEPVKDRLQNYVPRINVEEQLARRRKRLEEQGYIIQRQEDADDETDDEE